MENVGIIGLGNMGTAIGCRLVQGGYHVYGFDVNTDACNKAEREGIVTCRDLYELCHHAPILWLLLPAGSSIDATLATVTPLLPPKSIIIDAGNSHFTDSVRRAQQLQEASLVFLDCGTSGGLAGKERGFSLTIGGQKQAFEQLQRMFSVVAQSEGFGYVGVAGAGHYVKMVHNAIEYGLLQAYAEGFALLRKGSYQDLDLCQIATLWQHGAIIQSRLLELIAQVLRDNQQLTGVVGRVGQTGTGQWAFAHAQDNAIDMPALQAALQVRNASREHPGSFAEKLIAVLRHEFGGHDVQKDIPKE